VTRDGAVVLAAAVAALAAGTVLGYREVVAAGVALASALAGAAVVAARRPRVSVDAGARVQRCREGEDRIVEVTVASTGRRVLRGLAVVDGDVRAAVPALAPGAAATVALEVPARRRGRYELAPLAVVRTDPLGLVARRHDAGRTRVLYVHPRTDGPREARRQGRLPGRSRGGGGVAGGLRPHRPGDGARLVHWPSTVRRDPQLGQLLVRDADPGQPAQVVEVDAAVTDADVLDARVRRAAATAVDALRRGRPVELRTSGGVRARVAPGRRGRTDLLDVLAAVEPDRA
jgi:uncharacterized protein (DUF58 family)